MRSLTIEEQDQYIVNLARQVMNQAKITYTDYSECATAYKFAERIHERVWGWVMGNLTNEGTLGKVICCAVDGREVSIPGQRSERFTPLCNVAHHRMTDMNGIVFLRFAATWTICAAIYDIFAFGPKSAPVVASTLGELKWGKWWTGRVVLRLD